MRLSRGCQALFLLFVLLITSAVRAELAIPRGLTTADRKRALEILGSSSATKILGNPYPLGGYSGVEIGYTTEVIATSELSRLGSKSPSQNETTFSVLTLGKGIYNNVDLYLQFTPFTQAESISNFGGQLRWGFYQAEYLPAHLSLVVFGSSTNFQNKINTTTQGSDLVAGFSVQDMTLYTGLGFVKTYGTFVGGPQSGITDSGDSAQEEVSEPHYVAGVSIKLMKAFLAMQIDRYSQATYSAKLGLRF